MKDEIEGRITFVNLWLSSTCRWLKHNRFPVSKIGKLIYMVEDHEGNLQPKIDWFKSINLKGKELAIVLTREPRILEITIVELKNRVDILLKSGVRSEWIGWVVKRSPRVFACSKESASTQVLVLLETNLVQWCTIFQHVSATSHWKRCTARYARLKLD